MRSSLRRRLGAAFVLAGLLSSGAQAACDVANAGIEEVIVAKPSLQAVRDLRTLRDAAIVLETYKHPEECARLIAIVKEMVAKPAKTIEARGDPDEEAAERIAASRKPKAAEKAAPKS